MITSRRYRLADVNLYDVSAAKIGSICENDDTAGKLNEIVPVPQDRRRERVTTRYVDLRTSTLSSSDIKLYRVARHRKLRSSVLDTQTVK